MEVSDELGNQGRKCEIFRGARSKQRRILKGQWTSLQLERNRPKKLHRALKKPLGNTLLSIIHQMQANALQVHTTGINDSGFSQS